MYIELKDNTMTRTVDSPFTVENTEIKSDLSICRFSDLPPADIANPNKKIVESDYSNERYNWMRIKGTYLDGEFVSKKIEGSRSALPRQTSDIVKSHRYICLVDLRTELEIYITEDRFAELFNTVLFTSD